MTDPSSSKIESSLRSLKQWVQGMMIISDSKGPLSLLTMTCIQPIIDSSYIPYSLAHYIFKPRTVVKYRNFWQKILSPGKLIITRNVLNVISKTNHPTNKDYWWLWCVLFSPVKMIGSKLPAIYQLHVLTSLTPLVNIIFFNNQWKTPHISNP